MRPIPGRQQADVLKTAPKVLKTLLGLYKENVGQRSVGVCSLGSTTQAGLAGSRESLFLEGVVSVPIKRCFVQGLLHELKR